MSEPAEKFPQLACLTTSSGPFKAGTDTHMVIITPSKRKKPGIRYPMHIQAIKRKQKDDVMADWAEDRVHVLKYVTKTGDTNANPPHEGGKPNDHRDMVGKSMIQYDPQHVAASYGNSGKAALKFWAELGSTASVRLEWMPTPCQYSPSGESGAEDAMGLNGTSVESFACWAGTCSHSDRNSTTRSPSRTSITSIIDSIASNQPPVASRTNLRAWTIKGTLALTATSMGSVDSGLESSKTETSTSFSVVTSDASTLSDLSTTTILPAEASLISTQLSTTTMTGNSFVPSTLATSATPTGLRPGFNGIPGCANFIAPGSGQRYVDNYCNCGGTVAPLLTGRVDLNHVTLHYDYSTQPSWIRCPSDPTVSPTPTMPHLHQVLLPSTRKAFAECTFTNET
jgi:hypothetical protein